MAKLEVSTLVQLRYQSITSSLRELNKLVEQAGLESEATHNAHAEAQAAFLRYCNAIIETGRERGCN